MSWNNRVVWSEGMFLRPHHFQQQARYLEGFIESRCGPLRNFPWGFTELQVDAQLLTLGKVAVTRARGVFPDGTPFNIPDEDEPPPPLEIPENTHEKTVYLCLPTRRPGTVDVGRPGDEEGLARYLLREFEVTDSNVRGDTGAQLQVATVRTRFMLEGSQVDEYAALGVARVVESRVDKNVLLDEHYLPPVMDCHATALGGFLKELQGLLHHRADELAGRVSASGRGGAAEIADFLLLQAINRYEPLLGHLAEQRGFHPEGFYALALEMAGELSTFTTPGKRPPEFPPYRHDDLQATFAPVMGELRRALSTVLEQNAVAIPLEERKYGIRVAPIADRSLLTSATYVLAVSANIPTEDLRKRFPTQVKIGPVEQIRQLVNVQLPGIAVRPLPVAPRQLPYHSGFVYFELDKASEYWQQLQNSGGFAMHLGGDYPGIEMEFWAIRG